MPRRLIFSLSSNGEGLVHGVIGENDPLHEDLRIRLRVKRVGARAVWARAWLEHSPDHDPLAADDSNGTWTRIQGSRTPILDGENRAETKITPEADRPAGGFLRVVMRVNTLPQNAEANVQVWTARDRWENGRNLPQRLRYRDDQTDDTSRGGKDLTRTED